MRTLKCNITLPEGNFCGSCQFRIISKSFSKGISLPEQFCTLFQQRLFITKQSDDVFISGTEKCKPCKDLIADNALPPDQGSRIPLRHG